MKTNMQFLLGGLAAALFSTGAMAQASSIGGDCSKARDPARCEALQKAKESCKDKAAADKRKCMMEAMPPMDCSKARNPDRCAAMEKAKAACKDKSGSDYRQCLREQAPRRGKAAPKG
jgi:hypothetical protein